MHGLRQQDPPGRDLASQRGQTGGWHKQSYHPKPSPFQMEQLIWCYTKCKGEVGIGAAESLQSLPIYKNDSSAVSTLRSARLRLRHVLRMFQQDALAEATGSTGTGLGQPARTDGWLAQTELSP
jgi:hypothetical protein